MCVCQCGCGDEDGGWSEDCVHVHLYVNMHELTEVTRSVMTQE